MLHINKEEAMRQLQALEDQANKFVDLANKDEEVRKIKHEAVLSFIFDKETDEFETLKGEF